MGVQAIGQVTHAGNAGMGLLTSGGRTAWRWLHELADRLERVRVVHGDWSRCLNNHFGGDNTAVFLDPPYLAYEKLYGCATPVALAVEAWARENANLRIALCGHVGDYDLPDWDAVQWSRAGNTYGGSKTKDAECIWYSPACHPAEKPQHFDLFSEVRA
jgi:16S rRNA G966 N2-methylase RsmD